MALHLLLFTSDASTALILGKLLSEFEIEVEFCSEALASVEKVTRDNFDAIVVDWDDGPEATFLLKTARELKSTRECLVLALVSDAAAGACAIQIGAHGILNKPIVPEQIRENMGTIREMILSRQSSGGTSAQPANTASTTSVLPVGQNQAPEEPLSDDSATPEEASPRGSERKLRFLAREPRELPSLPPMPKNLEPSPREGSIGTIFSSTPYLVEPRESKAPAKRKRKAGKTGTRMVVVAGLICATGLLYVWAPGTAYFERLSAMGKSVFAKKEPQQIVIEAKPSPSTTTTNTANIEVAPQPEDQPAPNIDAASGDDSASDIQVTPVAEPSDINTGAPRPYHPVGPVGVNKSEGSPAPVAVAAPVPNPAPQPQPAPAPARPTTVATVDHARVDVPQSLRLSNPINPVLATAVTPAPPPAVGNSLTTIVIPEETARELLVKKVSPDYPEQALRAGVQGAVVLQAWIAKDGSVRDVKLLRGSFVLARAAVEAVKQWRYKPYSVNGQVVEAQTLITVSFQLPAATNQGTPFSVQPVSSSASDSPKP